MTVRKKAASKNTNATDAKRHRKIKKRNPAATKERIIGASIKEFALHGFNGARVERIVADAKVNMRMIYHYFKSKERLYTEALERAYGEVRACEQELHIEDDDPKVGLEKLINFTFQHFFDHPELVNMVMGENLLRGEYLAQSELVPTMSAGLLRAVQDLVRKGVKTGVFQKSVDPIQLWVTIFGLCWVHLSNKHTLSWMLQTDLSDPDWLNKRRRHVVDVIIQYLCSRPQTA